MDWLLLDPVDLPVLETRLASDDHFPFLLEESDFSPATSAPSSPSLTAPRSLAPELPFVPLALPTQEPSSDSDEKSSFSVKKNRNRASAAKYRQKRKVYWDNLESEVDEQKLKIAALEQTNGFLQAELTRMQQFLGMHGIHFSSSI